MGIPSLFLAVGNLVTETQVYANSSTQDHFKIFDYSWYMTKLCMNYILNNLIYC